MPMTPSTASPPSKKAEPATVSDASPKRSVQLPWAGSWPDRVGGARLGRSWPSLSPSAVQRAAQNRAAHTALLLLLGLVTGGIALATRHGGTAPSAEKPLLVADSSPNLNATSAPTVPEPARNSNTLDHAVLFPPEPPELMREPATMEAQATPTPPAEPLQFPAGVPVVAEQAPAVDLALSPTQPVESTMMRTWKTLGYQAILLAAFSAGPSVAAPEDAGKTDKPATAKDIEKLDKALQFMAENVAKDIKGLADTLNQNTKRTQEDIESLKQQLSALQKEVDALKKAGPQTTTAYRPATAKGRLELVNDYPYAMDIVINETAYPVAPGMTRVINLPPGATFTYRIPAVPGYQANRTRTLDGERPFKITVYPVQ
jgi:hypothetical protein